MARCVPAMQTRNRSDTNHSSSDTRDRSTVLVRGHSHPHGIRPRRSWPKEIVVSVPPKFAELYAQAAERSRQADAVYHLAVALNTAAARGRWFRRRRLRRLAGDIGEASLILTQEANRLEH